MEPRTVPLQDAIPELGTASGAPPETDDAAKRATNEMLEDYSLRYAPTTYRKWSEFQVANTSLGGIAYLADFAIGASLAITFGFNNALVAILLAATVIFLTSFPIAYYSAKYSIDMDLITRGSGFGYYGATITSLIYASFTFIFFALEGSIMAQGLEVGLGIPLWLGYFASAIIIPPLVIFGMTLLSKLQMWTQPLWLIGMSCRSSSSRSRIRARTTRGRPSRVTAARRRRRTSSPSGPAPASRSR
jgi:purine-cytosine permease-like protein